jgi:SsrA-binding protein
MVTSCEKQWFPSFLLFNTLFQFHSSTTSYKDLAFSPPYMLSLQTVYEPMANQLPEIKNKKAEYRFFVLESFTAGIQLTGSEIKSIRQGKANITEAFCKIRNREIYIINMYIAPYSDAGYSQHKERRERKLLLNKTEILKMDRKLKDTSMTIVPLKLFINEKGWAKMEIALAKGKNYKDKREDVKQKDLRREMDRGLHV